MSGRGVYLPLTGTSLRDDPPVAVVLGRCKGLLEVRKDRGTETPEAS